MFMASSRLRSQVEYLRFMLLNITQAIGENTRSMLLLVTNLYPSLYLSHAALQLPRAKLRRADLALDSYYRLQAPHEMK